MSEEVFIDQTGIDINAVANRCAEAEDAGESAYPGMSYEQGVATDNEAAHPFD